MSQNEDNSIFSVLTSIVNQIKAPILLFGIAICLLLIYLMLSEPEISNSFRPLIYTLSALIILLPILYFFQERQKFTPEQIPVPGNDTYVKNVFPKSDMPEFKSYAHGLIRKSQRLVLIGTGLNILQEDPFLKEVLTSTATSNRSLEIYLADPLSTDCEIRLIEEELGDTEPPVAKQGLLKRLRTILKINTDLGNPDNIHINLFSNYPTFALLIVDNEYFVYPYGFATLGNFSPVFQLSAEDNGSSEVIDFFKGHYKKIKRFSVPAKKVFDNRLNLKKERNIDITSLIPFALYFVPNKNEPLYTFGSEVLGYDIRSEKTVSSNYESYTGGAVDFGFHLTVCDALYFYTQEEIIKVIKQIEFILHDFRRFELKGLTFAPGFPDHDSVSIRASDPSGKLEVLHYEMVQQVYKKAAASNYSRSSALLLRDAQIERAKTMIELYKAPYILNNYFPHFTLLSKLPDTEKRNTILESLKNEFNASVKRTTIEVGSLMVMRFSKNLNKWVKAKEIELK